MKTELKYFALALALLVAAPLAAEETETKAAPPPPCSQPEASQFDFWLGEWDVEAKGKRTAQGAAPEGEGK
jgi:hypothetical protein